MDRRIYEERPHPGGALAVNPATTVPGGMIVHPPQAPARVPVHIPVRLPAGTQFDNSYNWQQNLTVHTTMDSRGGVTTYEPQMYYPQEIFSSAGGAAVPETTTVQMKTTTMEATHHGGGVVVGGDGMKTTTTTIVADPHLMKGGTSTIHDIHQIHATTNSAGELVVPAGTLVVSAQDLNPTQMVERINAIHAQQVGHPTTTTTTISVAKKKKRPVKSKKKQSKEDEVAESLDCSVYADDMVYIRSLGSASTPLTDRHTVNIATAPQHDPKAMRLLCPRPQYRQQQPLDDSDDEARTLAGVGVWEYGKVWNHHLTIKLLERLHKNKKRMFSRDSRKVLYLELSTMFQVEDRKDITTEEIEKKWCSLLSSYKRNQNRSKGGEEVSWGYYKIMDEIMTEGKQIRRLNRERPKRAKLRRLSEEELDLRTVKATCRRKSKKMKRLLMDRLDLVKQEREETLEEAKEMWHGVKETINSVNRNIAMLNSSVIMLGHTMGTFLASIDKIGKPPYNYIQQTQQQ